MVRGHGRGAAGGLGGAARGGGALPGAQAFLERQSGANLRPAVLGEAYSPTPALVRRLCPVVIVYVIVFVFVKMMKKNPKLQQLKEEIGKHKRGEASS